MEATITPQKPLKLEVKAINERLGVSVVNMCESLNTNVVANKSLQVRHTQVYYVNPWWTEFITSDGSFVLKEGKIYNVLTE